MLQQLEITNIALIEHVCIDFKSGLNVLTGETGAGKSIIIDSINAVLGCRITRELIRTGCESAEVTAVYDTLEDSGLNSFFEENGIPVEEDSIIISREFNLQGKNICRVNGKIAPLSLLKQVGTYLVDIHGQHDNQSLLNTAKHIEMLDAFGGSELKQIKAEYSENLVMYKQKQATLSKLLKSAKERESKLDLLEYQINEIKQSKLKVREEEELLSRKNILLSAEKIKTKLSAAYEGLYEREVENAHSAYDLICDALSDIEQLTQIDERYSALSSKTEELKYQVQDLVGEIRKEKENIDFSEDEIEETEDRLDLINNLKRKYGKNIADILKFLKEAEEEYSKLSDFEENTRQLEEEIRKYNGKLVLLAQRITKIRQNAALILEEGIIKHFEDLEMKNSKFKILMTNTEDFKEDGQDSVEFLISTNLGEPLKPLAKIASGGEMSRIMLAIKAMLAKVDNIPTLIFDEVDIGISGTAAARVGDKMAMLAGNHQVLCVTHIARIAACASNNIFIKKEMEGNSTKTYIVNLNDEDLVLEIARLLDGETSSEITKQHAKEMIENVKYKKSKD